MSVGSVLGGGFIQTASYSDPSMLPSLYTPADGKRYIVGTSSTGNWAGHDNYIARYNTALASPFWEFEFPVEGLQQYVADGTKVLEWASPDATSSASTGWLNAPSVRSSQLPFLTLSQLDATAVAMSTLVGTFVPLEFDLTDSRLVLSTNVNTRLNAPLVRFTGGVFTLSGGATLTINAIDAGEIQCFDVTATSTAMLPSLVEIVSGIRVNAKWFGATGDGSTDDTNAVQAAIDCAIKFTPLGGHVYIPTGNYVISAALMATPVVAAQGFALRGDGGRSSILTSHLSSGGTMLYVGALSGKKYDGVSIVDMGFQSAGSEQFLVNLDFNRDAIVDRCAFIGGNNIQLYVGSPQGQQVCNCDFFGSSTAGTVTAIYIGNNPTAHPGQAMRINNCIIRDFRTSTGTAIGVNSTTGSEMAIVDCDIEDNDCSINVDEGRMEITRNSFESGSVLRGISYPSGNAVTHVNTGNGFLEPDLFVPLDVHASLGAYKVACTGVSGGVATFAVTDPSGASVNTFTVSTAPVTFGQQIYFTLYPGTVAFASGDSFTVTVLNKPALGTITYSGTGNGTLTMDANQPVIAGAILGTYLLTCTDASASPQLFTVTDPLGGGAGAQLGTGTYAVGTAFADGIQFVINAGGTPFVNGDTFTVPVTALVTFATTGYAPSVVANPGVPNTGNGTASTVTPLTGVQSGTYTAKCTNASASPQVFTVYDTQGTSLGTVNVGTAFSSQIQFTITAGGTGFALGDSFQFEMIGDVIIKLGRSSPAESIICADNTMSGDGVLNQRFFDVYAYREVFIERNVFTTLFSNDLGYPVRVSPADAIRNSFLRFNSGALDPRTNIWFDPALTDGAWFVYGNSEGLSETTGADSAPLGATAPLVCNLDTLYFENTSATNVASFMRGYNGQTLTVIGDETSPMTTLKNGAGNILMASGMDELVFGNTPYQFRATIPPGTITPVWQQTGPSVSTPFDAATVAYLNAGITNGAAPLPVVLQMRVNQLVLGLKAAGLWGTFDGFYLTAVNDLNLAKVNLCNPGTHDFSQVGTLTFVPYLGISSSSTSNYANTTIARGGAGQWQANNASLTVWSTQTATTTSYAIGTSTGAVARIAPHQAGKIVARANDASSLSSGSSTVGGLSTISRTNSPTANGRVVYRNAVAIGNDAPAPGALSGTDTFYLLNDAGTVFHPLPVSMAAIGAGRSAAQELALYNAILPYMKAVYQA